MNPKLLIIPIALCGLGILGTGCAGISALSGETPTPSVTLPLAATFTAVAPSLTVSPTESLPPNAQSLPDATAYTWAQIASGFERPSDVANAGDGSGRLFVVEQPGLIKALLPGGSLAQVFLDIQERVGSGGNEQGLLGLVFHPKFRENGFLYVNYTNQQGNTVIARFRADTGAPPASQTADPASEQILLQVVQPYPNHNGGQVAFAPDGKLWIGLGDGGSGGDPQGNGQSLQTLLGKLLRVDVDQAVPYAIPADNPFAGGGGLPEIVDYGLRNPWRFSFEPQTGDLFISDVGQGQWEEINYVPSEETLRGLNFGWKLREGRHDFEDNGQQALPGLVEPVFEYGHDQGCSVTGGKVYRGAGLPAFNGVYLFGDYCSGLIWGLLQNPPGQWQAGVLFTSGLRITSFGVDEAGEVYLLDWSGGLYRLEER